MLEENSKALTKQIILDYAKDLKVKRANAILVTEKLDLNNKVMASYEILEILDKEFIWDTRLKR